MGLPPVWARVDWRGVIPLFKNKVQRAAEEIFQVVRRYRPSASNYCAVNLDDEQWIASHVHRIFITGPDVEYASVSWTSSRSGWYRPIQMPDVMEYVQKKEPKLMGYRQVVQEVWLLILAHGDELSCWVELDADLANGELTTGFARVFVVDAFAKRCAELRVRKS